MYQNKLALCFTPGNDKKFKGNKSMTMKEMANYDAVRFLRENFPDPSEGGEEFCLYDALENHETAEFSTEIVFFKAVHIIILKLILSELFKYENLTENSCLMYCKLVSFPITRNIDFST